MKIKKVILLFLVLFLTTAFGEEFIVDSSGYKLQNFYLSLNVENLWLEGHKVDWLTGIADLSTDGSTHCSAFVAAGCQRLNTYILRPPDHSQTLLANAQFDWLQTQQAAQNGWVLITDPDLYKIFSTAQNLANQGYVVTATCKNPDTTASGHIALVMPGQISEDSLNTNGPFVIMAGTNNYNRISLLRGFSNHIDNWPEPSIWFYYNKNINSVSTITSLKSGSWSNLGTWVGGVVPGPSDNVIVASGHSITIDNSSAACENISFENGTTHLSMSGSTSVLSVYGDFTLGSSTHQVFTNWPNGAKIKFKGTATVQTLSEWNTSGSSTSFMEMEVDKSAGKVVTAGTNMRFSFGTNLNIINGTFELASSDDIETKNLSNTGTQATITVQSNGIFNMVGGTSYFRKGTFTGEENGKSGIITVYGTAYLAGGSTSSLNLVGINVENGGFVEVTTGRSIATNSFNVGTITIKNGGNFQNDIITAYWYSNTTTPTLVDVQIGGELNITTSTFPMPQSLIANGDVRFSKTSAQTLPAEIITYNNLILSGSGIKSLGHAITVNGTLSLRGTANLALGGFTLAYGPSSVLQYGASGQISADTTTDIEWPASDGPLNVTIYNSGGVTLHANRTISGTLTLASGNFDNNGFSNDRTLTFANGAIIRRASGSLSVAPSFGSSINLEYYSNLVSVIASLEMPVSTTALNNLTISSTQGVTLGSNVTVNGILTLTGSNITTTSSKLLTLGSTATISGGSSSSFVNGPLARIVATTSPVVINFPVGKGTAYRPLQLTLTQSAATPTIYTAEQFNSAPTTRTLPGSLNSVSSVRYFNITKGTGSAITSASVQLGYDTDDLVSDASILRIAKDNGSGAWVDLGGTGTAPTTGTITSTANFTTFSDFVLARANSSCVLTLTALFEAMYDYDVSNGVGPVIPEVTVELHNSTAPYDIVESQTIALDRSGVGIFTFTTAVNGTSYYIGVKSPTTVETWSALPHSFSGGTLNYDFTTGLDKAYTDGSNLSLSLHNGKYCIYSGDIDKNNWVTGDDFIGVDNDNASGGYPPDYYHIENDLNGDGWITGDDFIFIDNNNSLVVSRQVPSDYAGLAVEHAKSHIQQKSLVK